MIQCDNVIKHINSGMLQIAVFCEPYYPLSCVSGFSFVFFALSQMTLQASGRLVHWSLWQNLPYFIGNGIQSKLCETFYIVEMTLDILSPANKMKNGMQLVCTHILISHIFIILGCHLLTYKFFLLLICEY